VVDHEACGVPEAVGAEPGAVPVARHYQEVDVMGDGGDDLALGPAPSVEELGVLASEPAGGGGQEVQRRSVRDLVGVTRGFVPGEGAS
jgi:hypothetical protein